MKNCTKCKNILSESMFNKSKRNKDGLRAECRNCQREQGKKYTSDPAVKSMLSEKRKSLEYKEMQKASDKKRNATEKRRLYKREKAHEPTVLKIKNEFSKIYKSNPLNKIKTAAQYAVRNALRRGEMIRGKCEYEHLGDCYGTPQGHHEDYNKPLDVRWLCGRHHKRVHLKMLD